MEINPQTVNPESPNSSNEHIFTYTLTWSPDQYRRGNIRIVDCNNDTLNSGWTTSGYATISFTANGRHHYLFQEERWFYHNFNGWGWWGSTHPGRLLQVFIDDINQNHPQNILGSYNGLPNDFELRDNGSTCPNNFASLSIGNVNWNDCNVPCFYEGDATELNIIQGSEYVTFIDIPTETILGSSVQIIDYMEINNIGLQRKDDAPGVQTIQTIKVEASINDVKDTLELEYFPDTFILNAEVYPDTLTTRETTYLDINYYNECRPLPPETKINLEIINGIEFGNLIDPYTNERVKSITNLDHWWGYAWVEYIADGKPKDGTDTITIRISTTDPEIIPKEINVYIKPPPIYVYTNPDVVRAADTAEVVIKKRNSDGTLEDFPQGQTFELAVLDGCVNGNILVGDSIGVYFSDAQLPIYFVAADSVEGDSGVVRLRVGTELSGSAMKLLKQDDEKNKDLTDEQIRIAELKAGYKKMMEEKKKEAIESKSGLRGELPTEAPILEVCYYGSYLYETGYWEGDVVVEGNECDFENCSDTYADIQVQLFRQYNNFEFRSGETISVCKCDTCTAEKYPTGQSTPVPFYSRLRKNQNAEWVNTWNLVACKNIEDKIELRPVATDINMPIPIYVDFVADVCYELINQFGNILVNDTTELEDENKIPDSDLDDVVNDICGHYCYPQVISEDGYILKEDVELHELLHMSHYQKILNDTKIDSLVNELKKDLTYSCQYYQQYIKTPEGASGDFKSKINQYIVKAEREYRKQSGLEYTDYFGNVHPGDPVKERKNELKIQNNLYLKKLIDSYHFALSKARGTDYPVTCFTCP